MNNRTDTLRAKIKNCLLLTDAGLETDLIFNHGIDLPNFASFDLLSTDWGRKTLATYYRRYLDLARNYNTGFILETPTWRASSDWGKKMGYAESDLNQINREAITFMRSLQNEYADVSNILISGNLGPRGDGYSARNKMTVGQARDYHTQQIVTFANAGADLVSAFTLNYLEEAIGIVLAARDAGIPAVLSFTVETDARLPSGEELPTVIDAVDQATQSYPLYYMINCAHPTHFDNLLHAGGDWLERVRGIRANASKCSHAELDEAEVLDDGDPNELAAEYRQLRKLLPTLQVFGGCCGTDHRHVAQMAAACIGPQ